MMVAVIVLMDQLMWRPVIAWADKFKFEQVESGETAQNSILNFIRKESFLIRGYRRLLHPIVDWLTLKFATGAKRAAATFSSRNRSSLGGGSAGCLPRSARASWFTPCTGRWARWLH